MLLAIAVPLTATLQHQHRALPDLVQPVRPLGAAHRPSGRADFEPGLVPDDGHRFLFTSLPASLGVSFTCAVRSAGDGGSESKPPSTGRITPATKLPITSSGITPFTRLTSGAMNLGPLLRKLQSRTA